LADLPAGLLLRVADLPDAPPVTLLNVSAPDDALRNEACRANLLHLPPSRAMLADALVQFLVVKRWRNIFLAVGPNEEDRLYAFYEVADPSPADATSTGAAATTQGTPATPSVSADTDNDAMTRSEERLHVDTTARVSGRARMRKYVVTEEVQVTVPVRREKVVLETESGEPIHPNASDQRTAPASDATALASDQDPSSRTAADDPLSHDEQTDDSEMILYEERPVVTTETVPVQRVRLGTTEDVVEETVTEEVRKERVQLDDATETPPHR